MLKITNFSKTYSGSVKKAVDDVSFEVKPGEIFGFIGPNGAGKSTTIKCLTGILNFDEGSIVIDGHDLKTDAIAAKKSVGYVSDSHIIYDKLTGLEYVNFMRTIYGAPADEQRLKELLDDFNLTEVAGNPIKSYSHGMKQKINVIGALIHNPKLLVLDEPFTGLDPQSAIQLKTMMRKHAENGGAVLFSSHVLDVVEKICDRVGIISEGKLVAVGTVDELRENGDASLESYFLSVTKNDDENEKNQ